MKKMTNAMLLRKIEALEKRVKELEAVAHPQSVMADPELTEAIKQLAEKVERQNIPVPTFVAPRWSPQPAPFLNPVYCNGGRTTVC